MLSAEAWAAMTKHPQDRRIPFRELAQKLGGRLIEVYYSALGSTMLSCSLNSLMMMQPWQVLWQCSLGHLKAIKTTKLFSVEETMEAMRKAGSLTYSGPSKG